MEAAGAVQRCHHAALGRSRAITDASASVVQTYQTDAFGVPTHSQGTIDQPFQYTGEPRDAETGFIYLRARVYDPSVGRFLSRDPLAGVPQAPGSLNRYTYVANNPIRWIDPSGLVCLGLIGGGTAEAGLGILGGAGTVGLGGGLCFGGSTGLNLGAFGQGGGFLGTPWGPSELSYPQSTGSFSLGAFAGAGGGLFASNATSIRDLSGPFETASLDVGVGPIKGSVQYAWSGDIWMLSITTGPGGVIGLSKLQTNTWVLATTDSPHTAVLITTNPNLEKTLSKNWVLR